MRRVPARTSIVVLALTLIAGAAAVAFVGESGGDDIAPRPVAERPRLLLLTSLPLIFSEDFTL